MQWSMHLQQFALIYTYKAHIMHKYRQKNIEYIYIYDLYIYFQGFIYAYMPCIYTYMAIYTLAHSPSCICIYAVRDPKLQCASHWRCRKLQSA